MTVHFEDTSREPIRNWRGTMCHFAICRHIREPKVTQDKFQVTCLACIKKLNDIPHTVSVVKGTKTIKVPL